MSLWSSQDFFAVHKATGMGVLEAKRFVTEADPLKASRIVEASYFAVSNDSEPPGEIRDPVENDPKFEAIVRLVLAEEVATIDSQDHVLGACHLVWRRSKERLLKEYGIIWFTPHELNPQIAYD